MKLTEEEKKICKQYSARDEDGYVHCHECPLVGALEHMIRASAMVVQMIDDAPTVDAVPVRRAHWIWKGDEGDSRFMCSECKCKEDVPTCMGVPNIWEYCPNCGARMKGADNE